MKQAGYPVPMTRVTASVVFIVTVLALAMLMPALSAPAGREWDTPLGAIPVGDLLALALGAFLAALVGGTGFRRWAAGLAALVWALRLAALLVYAPALAESAADGLVRDHLLGLPLGVVVAWGAAVAGERFAAQQRRERAAAPRRARWR